MYKRQAPALPPVQADPDRIGQVFANLLSNALRHTPAGGVITISAADEGDWVRFAVADSGPGLTPEEQALAFDRFWRADEARRRDRGGAGLGLPIARQLVRLHGGELWVESSPGAGALFAFRLPVAQPNLLAPPA